MVLSVTFVYIAVDTGDGEVFVLAGDLVEDCMKSFGLPDFSILAEIEGFRDDKIRFRYVKTKFE